MDFALTPATGVTVFCDPTLAPAVRALSGIGPPIATLSAPAASMLAQIARHARDDVLFTLSVVMDAAVAQGRVQPRSRVDGYMNCLVLAGLANRVIAAGPDTNPAALAALVARTRVAVTDGTVASGLDGMAVLAANHLVPGATQGVANTADVAFLVTSGAAALGLMYLTDVRADPRLAVAGFLTAAPAQLAYAAAANVKAASPAAGAFLALLKTPAAARRLQAAGLQVPAAP